MSQQQQDRIEELELRIKAASKALSILVSPDFELRQKLQLWESELASIARRFDMEGMEPKSYLDAVQEVFEMERGVTGGKESQWDSETEVSSSSAGAIP